ncbi:MAG: ASCH domain-containing protein [Candidatus Paceibacterota bacterium]
MSKDKLKETLKLSIVSKLDNPRSASIAYSKSGQIYAAGSVDSDTHLLNISSEQAVLALSASANDYEVYKIESVYEKPDKNAPLSPIIAKIIVDHQIRTGQEIEYEIFDTKGEKIFSEKNLANILPFYNPSDVKLDRTSQKTPPSKNKALFPKKGNFEKNLKDFALKGFERNFPTYDSASGYGSAVLTKDGSVYIAGQYSSFEHRMNIHSEMNAIISALMDKNFEITHLGLVSTKFLDCPCNSCGACRQFISEINAKFNLNIEIVTFSKDTDQFEKHFIKEYLPEAWGNRTDNLQLTTNNQKNKIKTLKFDSNLVPLVLSGEKNTTWRMFDDKNISTGDVLTFINKETGKEFAVATVTKVKEKELNKITDKDFDGHEKFESKEKMFEIYRKYYGNKVTQETIVKIIKFKLK